MSRPYAQILGAIALAVLVGPTPLTAQDRQGSSQPLPSIAEKTDGMQRLDGFFPLYWDKAAGQLWMEINKFHT